MPVALVIEHSGPRSAGARGRGCVTRGGGAALIVLLGWLGSPSLAGACSCIDSPPCQRLWAGERPPTVFEATVESIESITVVEHKVFGSSIAVEHAVPRQIVRLRDLRAWIGSAQAIVTTGPGICAFSFEVGQRYLIDAAANHEGQLVVSQCSLTGPVAAARETIAYLESLSRSSPGATLRGSVRFARGRFISATPPGITLDGIRIAIDGPVARSTSSGAAGSFAFDALPPGEYTVTPDPAGRFQVVPRPDGRPTRLVLPNAHACAEVTILLALDGAIAGTVIDDRGAPVQGVSVRLRFDGPAPNDSEIVTSDESGSYRFSNLPPGRYAVGVNLGRGPTLVAPYTPSDAAGAAETILLESGQQQTLAPLVVRKLERISVTGTARWSDGRPAVGVRLAVMTTTADGLKVAVGATYPDAAGQFRIDLLESVRYFIVPPGAASAPEGFDFVAGSEPLAITLPRPPH